MARRTAEAVALPEPAMVSDAPPLDGPRTILDRHIAAKVQRAADLADNEAQTARALDVLYGAMTDEEAAAKILAGVKAQALMGGAEEWRETAGVLGAQAALQDAQERAAIARTVRDGLIEKREALLSAGERDTPRIRSAVTDVIRTSPEVHALIAEATDLRRAWREAELVLDLLRRHFPGEVLPGWQNLWVFGTPPIREPAWRTAIAQLHEDAGTSFPP